MSKCRHRWTLFKGKRYCYKCKETAELSEADRKIIDQSLWYFPGLTRRRLKEWRFPF